jgi:hypothetical protein
MPEIWICSDRSNEAMTVRRRGVVDSLVTRAWISAQSGCWSGHCEGTDTLGMFRCDQGAPIKVTAVEVSFGTTQGIQKQEQRLL